MTIKDKILEYIQKKKKLSQKVLVEIREKTANYNDFKQMLLEKNLIGEEEFLLFLSKELKIPFLDLKKYKISSKNQEFLSQDIATKYKVVPICKIGNALTIATANPLDVLIYDDIKIITGTDKIALVLSREEDIFRSLNYLYKSVEDFSKSFDETATFDVEEVSGNKEGSQDLENLISESKHPPIVRAIDLIIYNALKKRASDIHVEPYESKLLIKYRIDGALNEEFSFPKKNQQAVIARLKIISGLDITESRMPQDGRFKVKFEAREIDFRVSSLPANFGEKFVL
ncbi:MAG: Flp pilus assembly complex ATPase component TadA, partial [Candidatus Omnitrophica bacterium]|nr:Flp pilus assembly complex ATPase component TadA [Candidatus Omnitrophota bacterium]